MKQSQLLFAMLIPMVLLFGGLAGLVGTVGPANNHTNSNSFATSASGGVVFKHYVPPIPAGYGGWESVNGGPWAKVLNSTTNGPSGSQNSSAYDLNQGANYMVEGAFGGNGVLTDATEIVSFSQFSGVSDSQFGNNAWSVQLNTNYFTGNNGQQDSVQFGFQNNLNNHLSIFSSHWSTFAIWTNDVTVQAYHCDTLNIPIQTLNSALGVEIDANDQGGNLNAQLQITTSSGYTIWTLSEPQRYGLSDHWSSASGTILGAGDSSIAQFTSPTQETTQITVSSSSSFSPYSSANDVTLEQNNLNDQTITNSQFFEPQYSYYGYTVTTTTSN